MTILIVAALAGLLLGSLLNVLIARMPKMLQREFDEACAENCGSALVQTERLNLLTPRAVCPDCGHRITVLERIPVLSYLVLRGKCSACKRGISVRYPAIEVASAMLAVLMIGNFGSGLAGVAAAVFALILLALTFIDLDAHFLPDNLTYPLLWLGLIVNAFQTFVPLHHAVFGAVAGYLVPWALNVLYRLRNGADGMGNGDFKLLAALGGWMGWQMLPVIVLAASVSGAIIGFCVLSIGKHNRGKRMAFGPYLTGAGLLAMVYAKEIMGWMNRLG